MTKSGMKIFSEIFKIEKKPAKGLMAFEWVVLAYMALRNEKIEIEAMPGLTR